MAIRIADPENTWSDACIAGDGNGIIFSAVKCDKLSFRSYDFFLFILVLKPIVTGHMDYTLELNS